MLEKFTIKQFAKAMDLTNAYVSTYCNRGKLLVDSEGYIDVTEPNNKTWILKMLDKGKTFDMNRLYVTKDAKKGRPIGSTKEKPIVVSTPTPIITTTPIPAVSEERMNTFNLAAEKTKLEVEKLRQQNHIDFLKIQKIEGALVPVDAVQDVFLWAIDTMHNTYQQELVGTANLYVQILGGDHAKFSELLKKITISLNKVKEEARENIIKGVEGVIEEYQEVRGRGERK